jgi:hypothetical protein
MGIIKDPAPVKYFCGIITAFPAVVEPVRIALEKILGEVDAIAGPFRWDYTSYYSKEMGEALQKYFLSFKELRSPAELSVIKIGTNSIEDETAVVFQQVARPVNLDPGYISSAAMILASTKPFSHRIYIGGGVYAQVDYQFKEKGRIEFNPWVYPDYKTTEYLDFFGSIRKELIKELNANRRGG